MPRAEMQGPPKLVQPAGLARAHLSLNCAAGGKKKAAVKRQKQMEVEEEPGGRWVAGVSAETGEDFIGGECSGPGLSRIGVCAAVHTVLGGPTWAGLAASPASGALLGILTVHLSGRRRPLPRTCCLPRCTAMDTAEGPAKPRAAQQGVGLAKPQQGKRGNRTRNQKRRKSANLEKALAFASKFETKSLSAGSAGTARKQAKGLWSKDDGGAGALP